MDALSDSRRASAMEWCRTTLFSRLDDKANDALVLVMQRLHPDDLAGYFIEQGGWTHLNLPAIAEADETIQVGPELYHHRQVDELLHPARESALVLADLKNVMGSMAFSAQYQQMPIPAGGNILKWEWFRWFTPNQTRTFDQTIISWDTASKASELSDYSVGTVWGRYCDFYYLLDLVRVKMDQPALRRKVVDMYHQWGKPTLLVEDIGSGTYLRQELRELNIPSIGILPDGDKVIRMSGQSPKIEAGAVLLPIDAPWLDDLRSEILSFPNGSHDDQVDSISQALKWLTRPQGRAHAVGA
jgi:predicted phage terminase large subunit-like protein